MAQMQEEQPAYRILLVDNDSLIQKVGKAILERCGCRVEIAGNGRDAVSAFSRQRYDLIFMDCQMPGMDGYEATGKIRLLESTNRGSNGANRSPIVALTGFSGEDERERCLRAGMDDYLGKPFGMANMKAILEKWLCTGHAGGVRDGRAGESAPAGAAQGRPSEGCGNPEDLCPIDPKALDIIASLRPQGADSVLRKVISLYLDSSRKLMKSIRESAEGDDADALHHAAHTLKSSSAYLGAMTLSGMCKELEILGRDKALGGTKTRVTSLEQEYGRVTASLEKHLERAASGAPPVHAISPF